jgi:hypothetical protein
LDNHAAVHDRFRAWNAELVDAAVLTSGRPAIGAI